MKQTDSKYLSLNLRYKKYKIAESILCSKKISDSYRGLGCMYYMWLQIICGR